MTATPRDIVAASLDFGHPERLPRDLWLLPWAEQRHAAAVAELSRRFPADFATTRYFYPPSPRVQGDPYRAGTCIDEWGCIFTSLEDGQIGEARTPLIADLTDWKAVQPPWEQLPASARDRAAARSVISHYYESTDLYVLANICPRPWERYQFIRGSENAYYDLADPDGGLRGLLGVIHAFNLRELEFWAASDVDGIRFMDDWGSQDRLLIHPDLWRELFKPLYREYCEIIHGGGKKVFMHSDGCIEAILPDLIEIGVDALNSQLFVMDLDRIARVAKGRLTFWGEIDRQHVLTSADPETGRAAVRRVAEALYDPSGGVIAQFEFGLGTQPATAYAVYDEWQRWDEEHHLHP
ncbi:MAG TPA: uroporphyrinogen decarboxylase family protein [bacterium]|nr:uroporphyrinogen decarboxylase family protein [bacterium]HPR88091.1 uroporphyrinogen decarboxylase family protein [bacterium]